MAFCGLFLIVFSSLDINQAKFTGVIYAALSGMFYASVVIINRKVKSSISTIGMTLIQMISASLVLLPIVLSKQLFGEIYLIDHSALIMILLLGVVHTGIAYSMYFSTYKKLPAITIGIFSYLEPVSSMIFAIVLLGEVLTIYHVVGGILILGSTLFCEIYENNLIKNSKV